jgi:hypothetical protein
VEPVVYTPISAKANLRRSTILGVALALIGIAICAVEGHPLMGVFGLLGILLGAGNNLVLQRSVIRYASAAGAITKGKFRGSVATRLGAVTLVSIGLALLVRPDGLGTFVGLAVFQLLMLVGAAVPVLRSLSWSL